jgi:organic hydroperoxide reductase OsmC/OhrA
MTSVLLPLQLNIDCVSVSLSGNSERILFMGKGSRTLTPIQVLEAALTGCIGLTLLSCIQKNGIDISDVSYSVRIGNGKAIITCRCPPELESFFSQAIETCYISSIINLKKKVVFVDHHILMEGAMVTSQPGGPS